MKNKTLKLIAAGFTALVSVQAGFAIYQLKKIKKLKGQFKTHVIQSDKKIILKDKEFSGDAILVAFGSLDLDLRGAVPTNKAMSIILKASYCGVKIIVPQGWNVRGEGKTFLGGFTNKCSHNDNPDQPLLIIHYDISFAGVEVFS